MQRFYFAAATAALTIIPIFAQAADLPRGGPAARSAGFLSPEPVANWSGFYVGVSAGYGWGDSRITVTTTGASSGFFDVDGGIVGGTFGYNRQVGRWVIGFETDLNATWIEGGVRGSPVGTVSSELSWLTTVRARVGYDYFAWLPYITGGAALGSVNVTAAAGIAAESNARLGWTIGAGIERMLMPNLSAKLEYLYVDLGRHQHIFTGEVDFATHIFRAGVNYRLGDLVR